jgi:hypothetical protein
MIAFPLLHQALSVRPLKLRYRTRRPNEPIASDKKMASFHADLGEDGEAQKPVPGATNHSRTTTAVVTSTTAISSSMV